MSLDLNTQEIQDIREQFRQNIASKKLALVSAPKSVKSKLTREEKQALATKRKTL